MLMTAYKKKRKTEHLFKKLNKQVKVEEIKSKWRKKCGKRAIYKKGGGGAEAHYGSKGFAFLCLQKEP